MTRDARPGSVAPGTSMVSGEVSGEMSGEMSGETPDEIMVGVGAGADHNAAWMGRGDNGFLVPMKGIFRSKNQAFWMFQTGGWLAYGLIRLFNALARGDTIKFASTAAILMVTGFLLSLLLRSIYRRVRSAPLPVILSVVATSCAIMALIFSTVGAIGYNRFYDPFWQPENMEYFGNAMFEAVVLLAWSSIYFGVNYFDQLQEAKEQALKATAMAHQAQLKMLRYQLNPHFLFNTLNAISTLVLDNDSKNADGMLGRLSSFLRYTLVNQPTQKVSLEQELHALSLYLDIEKVRFEERLEIIYDVDEAAKSALMPSLLLQPLIENAIKFAIAPAEEGGRITIFARVNGTRLILGVADNGPGIDTGSIADPALSSGVGIVNTRERLEQIYPDDHAFRLEDASPSGLSVVIEIPCETDLEEADEE